MIRRAAPRKHELQRRAHACVLVVVLALMAPPAVWAGRPVRVYEVDVAERSGTALQEAMREALVRATGRREAADDPALAGIVADAPKYVSGYGTGPRGESQVSFDGAAVQAAITAAGRSVWDGDRPFTLIVLDPPRPRAQAEAARAELERTAAARGLPISLIPMALNDAGGKPLPAESLLEAAQRVGGDEVLVGRGDPAAADAPLQWTLYGRGISESWSGPLAAGIDHTVDRLVPQGTPGTSQAESDVRAAIDGVRTLNDYAAVTRLLQATPGVRRATLLAAEPQSLVFIVTVRGGAGGLEQALAGQAHLVHSGSSAGRTLFRYQP